MVKGLSDAIKQYFKGLIENGKQEVDILEANAEIHKIINDLEEQGLLLKKEDAVDKGYLYDWYIHSVNDDEPVWTESHIEELCNDFILIPKAEAEKALEEMKGE